MWRDDRIQLYILADTLLVRGLEDAIITALIPIYGYTIADSLERLRSITLPFWYSAFSRPAYIALHFSDINLA